MMVKKGPETEIMRFCLNLFFEKFVKSLKCQTRQLFFSETFQSKKVIYHSITLGFDAEAAEKLLHGI